MRTVIAATLAVIALLAPGAAAAQSIIPLPVKVTPQPGHFRITPTTTIWTDRSSASLGHQLARWLEPATCFILRVQTGGALPARSIALRRDASLKHLGAEGYRPSPPGSGLTSTGCGFST